MNDSKKLSIIAKLIEEDKLIKLAEAIENQNEEQIFSKIDDQIFGEDFDEELKQALSILNGLD